MADLTITAANSVYMLAIRSLVPVPQQLQGFATDSAFDSEASEMAEVRKGVDGRLSAGWRPFIAQQSVALMADSPSGPLFDGWIQAQKIAKNIYFADATIALPSIGIKFTLTKGVLRSGPMIPGVRAMLEARTFQLSWDDITASPI